MNVASKKSLEVVPCPLCGSKASGPWGFESGYHAVKCRDCGLVYVNPRPSADRITESTKLGQHETESGVLDVRNRWHNKRVSELRQIVKDMFREEIAAGRPLQWLDIGAGYGEFVSALNQTLPSGSKAVGIEPMDHKVKSAEAMGLPVSNTALSKVSDSWDVISLMNVFSHIPDFGEFLKDMRAKLRAGGEVFVQTGNGGDLASQSDYPGPLNLPDHLVFAGVQHIEKFLEQSGFELISKREFRIDNPMHTAKNVAKRLLGRPSRVMLPYTSPFRTVYFRARAVS